MSLSLNANFNINTNNDLNSLSLNRNIYNNSYSNAVIEFNESLSNIEKEKIILNKFINNELKKNDENIDLFYSINKNNIKNINEDTIDSLYNLKNEILEQEYKIIENNFNKILKIQNNIDFIHNTLNQKINTIEKSYSTFINKINNRNKKINTLRFFNLFYENLIENKSSLNNQILENYISDYENLIFNNSDIQNNKFLQLNNNKKTNSLNIDRNKLSLLTNITNLNELNKIDENGIIVQSYVNFANLLFSINYNTIVSNPLKYNYNDENKFILINNISGIKTQDYVVLDKEKFSFNFNNDILNKLNLNSLTLENAFENILYNTFNNNINIKLTDFEQNLLNEFKENYSDMPNIVFLDATGRVYNNRYISSQNEYNNIANEEYLYSDVQSILSGNIFETTFRKKSNNTLNFNEFSFANFIFYKTDITIKSIFENKFPDIYFKNKSIFTKDKNYIKLTDDDSETTIQAKYFIHNNEKITKFSDEIKNYYDIEINKNEFLFKFNKFVKNIKLKRLQKLDIKLDLFFEIFEKIKNSKNINYLLSYIENDIENISVCDKKDKLYNILFSKNEEIYKSNFSLITSESVDGVKFENIENNINLINNKTLKDENKNIKNIFSNYFDNTCFSSSSKYLRYIFKKLNENNFLNQKVDHTHLITNELYFNYLNKNDSKKEVVDLVIKRFIKNALLQSENCSIKLKNSDLKEFKYDFNKFKQYDYENTSKLSLKKYIDDIKSTSESLNILSDNIFSKENIESISNKYNFFSIKNFIKNTSSNNIQYILINSNQIIENFLYTRLVFPFINIYKIFDIKTYLSDKSNVSYITNENITNIYEKNIIEEYIEKNKNNIDETKYRFSNLDLIDIRKNKDIYKLIELNNSLSSCYRLEDKFDDSCKSNGSLFKIICDLCLEIIKYTCKNFNKNQFNSESDIDNFIENNKFLYETIYDLIDLLSPINDYINKRIVSYSFLKSIEINKNLQNIKIENQDDLKQKNIYFINSGVTDRISDTINNRFVKEVFDIPENQNIGIKNNDILFDIKQIFQDINLLEKDVTNEFNYESEKSKFINNFNYIFQKLNVSDYSMLVNADIINSSFDISDSIVKNSNQFIDQEFIELSNNIGFDINRINNIQYLNFNLKKMNNVLLLNNEIKNNFLNKTNNNDFKNYYLNQKIFNEVKNSEKHVKPTNISKLLTSNIYGFCYDKNIIDKINSEIKIIKITLTAKDMTNNNKIYLPKNYLFSSNISNFGVNKENYPYFCESINSDNLYILFDNLSNDIQNVLFYLSYNQIRNNFNNSIIKNLAKNSKLINIANENRRDITTIYQYMIDCQKNSININNYLNLLYDLNINNIKNYSQDISDQIINALSESQISQIFNNSSIEKTKNTINKFLSLNNQLEFIKDQKIVDIFNVSFDINDQYFILLDNSNNTGYINSTNEYNSLGNADYLINKYFNEININDIEIYKSNNNSLNDNIIIDMTMELI